MAFTVNTNTLSLVAQNNLNQSQKSLNSAIERLSSGSKINSAKDDAAGQAISNRLTAQINGLNQASSNANDGISLAQTTEGALDQVNDNLQRVRELTVQAANGTNSDSDLKSIQNEIDQRLSEIDRISDQTSFNGTKVLNGDASEIKIQVGSEDGQTISLNLSKLDANELGLNGFSVAPADISSGEVDSAEATAGRVGDNVTLGIQADGNGGAVSGDAVFAKSDGSGFVVSGDDGNYYDATVATDGSGDVSFDSSTTAVAAADVDVDGGEVTTVKSQQSFDAAALSADQTVKAYTGSEEGAPAYVIEDTSGDTPKYFSADIATDGTVTQGEELSTNPKTADPLAALDSALNKVDDLRSDLGAAQNRFDSAISNIESTTTNISAARSRIVDADYATEVSNLSKAQILQQAGTSVLAQANQTSQGVLSLLG